MSPSAKDKVIESIFPEATEIMAKDGTTRQVGKQITSAGSLLQGWAKRIEDLKKDENVNDIASQ